MNSFVKVILKIEDVKIIEFLARLLFIITDHDSEIYQEVTEGALSLMESPKSKDYIRENFNTIKSFCDIFKQRGQQNNFKRVYYLLRDCFENNVKGLDIQQGLNFIMMDFDFIGDNSEVANLVFQHIIQNVENTTLESIPLIYHTLSSIKLSDEQMTQLG